ncbi:hypothetical protein PR048_030403 [Dryococelus australis]|uniref:K Homology domain-containing protein n=1 Tax=Dryococelus australis TaxID=614101 RepID=A0ABQ9G9N9_9NEOP|nr:hypothetical protein PR048_030403 [Dryococelus australis]
MVCGNSVMERLKRDRDCSSSEQAEMANALAATTPHAAEGRRLPAVIRAKELIMTIVQQRSRTEGVGPGMGDMNMGGGGAGIGGGGGGGGGGGPGNHSHHVEIMVPGPKVGLIIGKGGETIKQLQEKSGARMIIIQEGSSSLDEEKPLRIIGDPQKVEYAKQLVYDLIAEKEMQQAFNRGAGGGGGGPRGGAGGGNLNFEEYGGQGGAGGGGDSSEGVEEVTKTSNQTLNRLENSGTLNAITVAGSGCISCQLIAAPPPIAGYLGEHLDPLQCGRRGRGGFLLKLGPISSIWVVFGLSLQDGGCCHCCRYRAVHLVTAALRWENMLLNVIHFNVLTLYEM